MANEDKNGKDRRRDLQAHEVHSCRLDHHYLQHNVQHLFALQAISTPTIPLCSNAEKRFGQKRAIPSTPDLSATSLRLFAGACDPICFFIRASSIACCSSSESRPTNTASVV
ncbi:hypothetical protein DM01DRAFT_1371365 [Hesseltinella vesiculosa]|uniref:Uncharacterized protein n=1 Tax=Hesseltinella vesiculosa TaxID=101127 RepID=A0A1X2GQV7_9FUNG|nr:hypothetical protein DM01DRAFT_1371365 [Hesseltinella vesiculosa]